MSGKTGHAEVAERAARADRDAPASIAELDAELAISLGTGVGTAPTRRGVWGDPVVDDQASRLRAIVAAGGAPAGFEEPPMEQGVVGGRAPLTIAVASGKGGVGKTNVAVNLAVAFASAGHRVTLLDADLGTANADVLCGLTPSARLDHVLTGDLEVHDAGRRTLRDILVDAPGGFRLIPGSAGIARMADLSLVDRRALLAALADLDHDTDLLIVDTAAGVGSGVTSFIDSADTCVVVSTPEPTSVADAYALIKCASATSTGLEYRRSSVGEMYGKRGGLPRFQLVMNQCADAMEARRVAARIGAVCDRFLGLNVPLLGWVAQDVRVGEAVRARRPLLVQSPEATASRNISALAAALAQQMELPDRKAKSSPARGRLAWALRRLLRVDGTA